MNVANVSVMRDTVGKSVTVLLWTNGSVKDREERYAVDKASVLVTNAYVIGE